MDANANMTRILVGSMALIVLIAPTFWPAPYHKGLKAPLEQEEEEESGWLHVEGRYIKDASGQNVFLRGAAIGDLSWRTSFQGDISQRLDQLSALTDGKANIVRCTLTPNPQTTKPSDPFYPWTATLVDVENNIWETETHPEVYMEEVDELLTHAERNNIRVIVEFHGGFTAPGNIERYGGDPMGPNSYVSALALDPTPWIEWHLFWVNRYSDDTRVIGFELWNEPWDAAFGNGDKMLGKQRWVNMATQAAEAIDEANPDALIIVPSVPYSQVMQEWVDDPLPYNVVYGWDTYYQHWADYWKEEYRNGDYQGGYEKTYRMLHQYHIGAAVDAGLPTLCNEFGWTMNEAKEPAWETQMADFLTILKGWEANWYIWMWWNSANFGLARNNDYSELSPYGQVWADNL